MAHPAQREFFERVRRLHPRYFVGGTVLDCGSLNINGSLRDLFAPDCFYLGIDIHPGPDVNVVWPTYRLPFSGVFDAVVSGEMLEHSEFWAADLQAMYRAAKPGGLVAVSCAGPGREEHGTRRTGHLWNTSPDYYRNLSAAEIRSVLSPDLFVESEYVDNPAACDTYFYGIRRP